MLLDIDRILYELKNLPEYECYILLQSASKENKDPFGLGRVQISLNACMQGSELSEEDFIHPIFDFYYINSIMKKLNMKRTRVMRMPPMKCTTYHIDATKRIHIPLITNDDCFFVIEDEIYRLPVNENYYIVDTTKRHTFVNASDKERIHIVGVI